VVAPVVRAHLAVTGSYPTSAAAVRADATRLRRGTPLATVAQDLVAARPAVAGATNVAFVRAVYRNALGRNPTTGELTAQTGRLKAGTTRGALVAGLVEGSRARAFLRSPVDVVMLYLGMLGRAPEPAGYAHWVPETRRKGVDRLIRGFQGSPEYRARVT
jgi:hypothetical protein